jgi:hypothetical protein
VKSKTDTAMVNEVLCKFLAYNLCCLIHEQEELGIAPIFWKDEADEVSATLPMIRAQKWRERLSLLADRDTICSSLMLGFGIVPALIGILLGLILPLLRWLLH